MDVSALPHVLGERFAADLGRLVRCESPSDDTGALARSADLVAAIGAEYLGTSPERIVSDGRPHLRWHFGPAGDERVLILGHHDTVWPIGTLERFPFEVDNGVATGPGSFDMKAGILQAFAAVAAQTDRSGITLLVTADEEIGAPTSRTLIEDHARRSPVTLVFEASSDGGAVKTARKGVSRYAVDVRGVAAHAGLEPWNGVNATIEAAHQILHIASLGAAVPDASTVTPTLVSSGSSANTVPDHATIAVDVRSTSLAEQQRIDGALRTLEPVLRGAEIGTVREISSAPLEERHTLRLYSELCATARELGLSEPDHASVGGGSDGNYAAGAGSEVLDGLGAIGAGAHRWGEYVDIAPTIERTALVTAFLTRVLAGGRES